MELFKKISKPNLPLLFILLLFQIIFIISDFHIFDINTQIGVLDNEIFWEGMKRITYGEVLYKDFYWEYGLLYLLYGLPLFILMDGSFKAYLIIRFFLFPITNLVLLYLIGSQFLKDKWLLLFVLLATLYGALNFVAFRHLLPELGLALFIVGIKEQKNKKVYLGSTLLGLSFTSSLEYAVIALLVLALYLFILLIKKENKIKILNLFKYLLPTILFGSAYLAYLLYQGALSNMITYYLESAQTFYWLSPCRETFPRLSELKSTSFFAFISKMRLYIVPGAIAAIIFFTIKANNKLKFQNEIITLTVFAAVTYFRTVVTPCEAYLQYSMPIFFLILLMIISGENLSVKIRNLILTALLYFLIMPISQSFSQPQDKPLDKKSEKPAYSNSLKIKLDKNIADEFEEVLSYLEKATSAQDTVYVYPHGSYHHILNRRSPIGTTSTLYLQMSPSSLPRILKDFESNPPDYVILNGINASDYYSNFSKLPYNFASQGDTAIFTGNITEIEKYISSNYKIAKKFDRIWILKKREEPAAYLPPFVGRNKTKYKMQFENATKTEGSDKYRVTGQESALVYLIKGEDLKNTRLLKIPIKYELGPLKTFSKYYIDIYASEDLINYQMVRSGYFVSGDWQDLWLTFGKSMEGLKKEYFGIKVKISKNLGFLPFPAHPQYVEIKNPETYTLNPEMKIDDYLLDVIGYGEYMNVDGE